GPCRQRRGVPARRRAALEIDGEAMLVAVREDEDVLHRLPRRDPVETGLACVPARWPGRALAGTAVAAERPVRLLVPARLVAHVRGEDREETHLQIDRPHGMATRTRPIA